MHCDSVTAASDKGYCLSDGGLQANLRKLRGAGCIGQCFAVFTDGENARENFYKYLSYFTASVQTEGFALADSFHRHISLVQSGKSSAFLTVENLGFTEGDGRNISSLADCGVIMASLVWNRENRLAYPHSSDGGLKEEGRRTLHLLDKLKIIVDVSHLSDGGTDEILKGRKIPVVASHSNARSVCRNTRNLTDGRIRAIAECGGVIGVNFCKKFLGEGAAFDCVLNHIRHIIKVGGEDVVAFGSDFDGIPLTEGLEGCEKMPALIEFISDALGCRTAEKLCRLNFERVLREVRP